MGLSGAKRRIKISSDPNNTTWSRSTDGFGHKILSAQGWKPGQLLGAENAPHAEHLTAANASHIRVVLREDNLGLGAKLGKSNADTFGLSTLSSIFGRLNGKSDAEVEKMQNAQRDVQLRTYQSQRWGTMNFVSGGLLVGDKMLDKDETVKDVMSKVKTADKTSDTPSQINKKRTREEESDPVKTAKKSKISKVEKVEKQDSSSNDEANGESDSDRPNDKSNPRSTIKQDDDQQSKQKRREMKALRKAEKRERKEAKKKRKADRTETNTSSAITSGTSTPNAASGSATPQFAGSRHAVRQRYIAQKRLASMDPRALNEILMLKTAIT
ncbi:hypothetical protein MRB53_040153 [Persea americana]|nr:hypothetical protein MRB53_040153 [Persea americana]